MPVPYKDQKDNNNDRVVQRYSNYLNGPMGKRVMENIEEGDSFVLETSTHMLRITKIEGKAIVNIIKSIQ